ncbi:MAG TPA: xanthine dehydrogenase family protein molybdopterin-binding subunit [Candidatus Eisenbacteria bacterium]
MGTNVARKEGMARATGAALYADDLSFPGMLHGRTIRSSIPRGRVTAIALGFDRAGFTVVDHRDIPGENCIALIERDQPCLAADEVRHSAEPLLLLAHADRDTLASARVDVRYEPASPLLDPAASEQVFKHITIEKGNLARGFERAETIVEGSYSTGAQEHVYIEPNGVIAVPEPAGLALYGSMQCPYYVLKALKVLLGGAVPGIRVIQTETGGGFGGKEEYPSIIAAHACLLALKSGRPVKLVYDRGEDMVATTKRHPSVVRHRTGLTRDGKLTAMQVDVLMDGGAYCTLSPVVLSRGVIHAAGPYRCANTRIEGRVVMTNTPPYGAFRGFGAPQTQFAMEVHMDRIAETLGIDPVTLRLRNALKPGDTTATGQKLGPDTSAVAVLREAVRRTGFKRKRAKLAGSGRGIGLSLFYHGAGFTGSGEVMLGSRAGLETTPRGVRILVANTEIGQGTRTMLAQIVADALGIGYDEVDVAEADTSQVPDSGPTVASRTCMVVGGLLERCARTLRERLAGATPAEHHARHGRLHVEEQYAAPEGRRWDDATYRGDAYATFAWGCDVCEVALDPVTHEARVAKLTAVQEFGRAIHPAMAQGQIEGGSAQGLGWALLEQVVMRDGAMANGQLTNYVIPTTLDTPPMDIVMLENPYAGGPFGAKGLGELPIDGPAPAVVNAIRHAGLDVRAIPATPEALARAPRLAPQAPAEAR